ncbi:sporulation YhaL family protein [Bacillus massilinigeriensis]|uniref:sporulation YhaL family protein n=1 Tax=Bacillus mediterraneensis TaxID=1805474 RepID=UPI0008F82451|nr:sporulation YhaL family protein [Bacillus mediterraneensis]
MTIPIWVMAVAAGVLISAIMAVKTGKEERRMEEEIIEREGDAYMKRLEEEKARRTGSMEV